MRPREIAEETMAAIAAGRYREEIARAVAGTVLHDPSTRAAIPTDRAGAIEVTGESTLAALQRLANEANLGCLNFASAKNPGGGFLRGAVAQEEMLARASGLFPCLETRVHDHYEPNRRASLLYLDLAIYSPAVPFFRDDAGGWLARPVYADVITCAAPNAGALAKARDPDLERVPEVLRARAELVLRVAAAHDIRTFVLGAWGAGVFGNDPTLVADAFGKPLEGLFAHAFDRVTFAIYGGASPNRAAFDARFG